MLFRPELAVVVVAAAAVVATPAPRPAPADNDSVAAARAPDYYGAGPCDIYQWGNTPCVAAHSTTRALYRAYHGPLYRLRRDSDNAELDIKTLWPGGVADAGLQDSFCDHTTCLISILYDQSGRGNHLKQALGGTFPGPDVNGWDNLASAIGAPVTLIGGRKAYGVFVSPGTGYRNNEAHGTAIGDQPQGMYAVLDATHFNDKCCFDYGNAETSGTDTGNGHMETIYFGSAKSTSIGAGSGDGPWIQADLENGLFAGITPVNQQNPSITGSRFITAVVKGEPNHWAIRGADAVTSPSLGTFFDGPRPNLPGYSPMSKEGAILLGVGGDNGSGSQGTFYEGAITAGYPSDDIENIVQANIASVRYAVAPLTSGPTFRPGSTISLRATTPCCSTNYLIHNGADVFISKVQQQQKQKASWTVRTGLANDGCFSFESVDTPGSFLRHSGFKLVLNPNDGSKLFREDATYCPLAALNGQGNSIRSWSFPTRFIRHYNGVVYTASNGGTRDFDKKASFNDDVSWVMGPAL
ncbi:alpha-N-arabinofuranosidase precursor [Moelleriella libera RCEF 2490]|uniref:Alpha-L-arabinofuranosidase n=1 Tax=Moelleriella libera RCEF 2490 TaxID=1081109 RepID=A0A166NLE7_9HYPO|nr:alpha-N-arabinofuranosidase precursor [Moelleriella libera RCEF 2490]